MRMSRKFWEHFIELTVVLPAFAALYYVQDWTKSLVLGWLSFGVVGAVLLVLFNLILFRDEFEAPSLKEFIAGVVSLSLFPLVICFAILFTVFSMIVLWFSGMFIAILWRELLAAFFIFFLLRFCIRILLGKTMERNPKVYSAVIIKKEIE